MTDIRLPSSGNIKARWHAINAFADPSKPTPTEVNAGLPLENSISWNDYDFGLKASTTNNDPALSARSNVADRGAIQYGGGISFYLPLDAEDTSNEYAVVHEALRVPRTEGWITLQLDGELSETSSPSYTGGITQTAASGDLIDVFRVLTAGYANADTGEEAFRETVTFLPQGEAYPNAVVATSLTVVVLPATAAKTAASAAYQLSATVNGRNFTYGVRWTTSDPTKATVSQNGVVKTHAAGSVTITATKGGATDTHVITIS